MTVIGVGLGPRNRITEAARQHVLDTAADLQIRRSRVAAALAQGDTTDGEIVARGFEATHDWMHRAVSECSELLSVRPAATVQQLQVSVPNNRIEVERGMRMTSIFDYDGVDPDARLLLAGEPDDCYAFGVAPVQMKILDADLVVVQGPFVEDELTLMALSSPGFVAAAGTYWQAVLASSFPAVEAGQGFRKLTDRQRQILALLATDAKDEAIAASLGVSVRTVRTDVAAILKLLGVRSRFAAGLRVRRQVSVETPR